MSAPITPFEIKLEKIISDIEKHSAVVENEASMAHATAKRAENDLQRSSRATVAT